MNVDKDSDRDRPRILIVGGVAGGASCAARVRRLSEKAKIVIFERGPYVSFANCGLPYYVGDIITSISCFLRSIAITLLWVRTSMLNLSLNSSGVAMIKFSSSVMMSPT